MGRLGEDLPQSRAGIQCGALIAWRERERDAMRSTAMGEYQCRMFTPKVELVFVNASIVQRLTEHFIKRAGITREAGRRHGIYCLATRKSRFKLLLHVRAQLRPARRVVATARPRRRPECRRT